MKKLSICVAALLLLASCKSYRTSGAFLTEQKDAWMNGYSTNPDDAKNANKGLAFCRANIKDDGKAAPVCFNAKFVE